MTLAQTENPGAREPKKAANVPSASENSKAQKKVLIIDDTEEIRMLISESLKLYGFTTLVAPDGEQGIQMARQHLPNLIICDIRMPKLDGYGALTALREEEATSTIPFIFLSGASEKMDMRRGMELGADDYLTKPFTHKELMAAVNARLEKQAELQRVSDKKLDELRGNITMALPHELRTPLNGIMGLASLIIDDHGKMPPSEVLESAKFIHESALRLHRLIENFLVYSQIQLMAHGSKRIEISNSVPPIQAQAIIAEVARAAAERYRRSNDLDLVLEPASLFLPVDNFRKIIEELVDNAFKFSERGKPVHLMMDLSGGMFHLHVSDHGRGMTPEQIARIGPHMQFDRKTFEQQGAGLGMVIAKSLTELLGGQFAITSRTGQETTVKISFPSAGK
jgi:DNA-binding response OmpR family regulator/two-component sensor histidine kinase